MAIAFVNKDDANNAASSTTIATAGVSHTAGNLLVVGAGWITAASTITGITDTAGNTYVQVSGARNTSNATAIADLWYVQNCLGNASNVVTVTFSTSVTSRKLTVNQYSGIATSGALDQVAQGYTAFGTSVTSGNLVTTQADEVLFAWQSNLSASTLTAGSSFTLRNGSSTIFQSEDRIVSSTSTYTCGMTGTTNSVMIMCAATFKAVAAGGRLFGRSAIDGLSISGPKQFTRIE